MSREILVSPSSAGRLAAAAAWLSARSEDHVTIVGASPDAASEVARLALTEARASFGWQRTTLDALAVTLARSEFANRTIATASTFALEAVCARVVHTLRDRATPGGDAASRGTHERLLGRFAPLADRPGFPRALARSVAELRLAGDDVASRLDGLDADLSRLLKAFETELDAAGLADRARTLRLATDLVAKLDTKREATSRAAILLVDVPLRSRAEQDFVAALAERASCVFATLPAGDDRSLAFTRDALASVGSHATIERLASAAPGALGRLHSHLFADAADAVPLLAAERADAEAKLEEEKIEFLSAPFESRESVEIVRAILAEAARGTKFDRIAVLLRAPGYATHLGEAFRRAGVPAHVAHGTEAPEASGRAMMALLACAAEGLSARRFAEYLTIEEAPGESADSSPEAAPGASVVEEDRADVFGSLRTPRYWERLLVDAAVLSGHERWRSRLDGLHAKLSEDLEAYMKKADDALADAARRDRSALEALRTFALPLIADLAALPGGPEASSAASSSRAPCESTWGAWQAALTALATRALRYPQRVLEVLDELRPMADVGPVDLREVRLVLGRRLGRLPEQSVGRRYGKVYIANIEEARGLAFDVVFVPGLANGIFPQKVREDPLLLDRVRSSLGTALPLQSDRMADEQLALRIAVGAASRRVVFCYPRVEVGQGRPRTPSFYGLELLRVAEGELRDSHDLATRDALKVEARLGWHAPADRTHAIDEAEYDLALLQSVLDKSETEAVGKAHYLLSSNAHLARALRFRGRRWLRTWKASDGLVDPPEEALVAIREHAIEKRSFSPTALQNFASCPYRFLLSAVHRLAKRRDPAAIEELDPLTRGSLVHEVQFELLTQLRNAKLLPVTRGSLEAARSMLDSVLAEVSAEERDRLHPAIERVWQDAMESIAADLREWLRRMADEPDWTPAYFELSFGLKDTRKQDSLSKDNAVLLDAGIQLRGSIDLVEESTTGALRATDHKTGKPRAQRGDVIKKGEILQPVLYALTVEKLFPGRQVKEGRLYYCTTAGDFSKVDMPLDQRARDAAQLVATTIGGALNQGFLPAAPAKDACRYCDYRSVCGPYEEIRTKRKSPDRLKGLLALRNHT